MGKAVLSLSLEALADILGVDACVSDVWRSDDDRLRGKVTVLIEGDRLPNCPEGDVPLTVALDEVELGRPRMTGG